MFREEGKGIEPLHGVSHIAGFKPGKHASLAALRYLLSLLLPFGFFLMPTGSCFLFFPIESPPGIEPRDSA
jgi:hypothetical protein